MSDLLPEQLNITDKTYNFHQCNLYQKMIYKLMAQKIDQLQALKQAKAQTKDPAEQNRINTALVKGVGVLEFFQERFEAFEGLIDVELITNLSLYGNSQKTV